MVDFFCKRAGFDDPSRYPKAKGYPSAGMRMVATCDHFGVTIDDLVEIDTLRAVRGRIRTGKKEKGVDDRFSFTRLRDDFVHEGFDTFEGRYDEVSVCRGALRAMAERILAAKLGADISGTHVGAASAVD